MISLMLTNYKEMFSAGWAFKNLFPSGLNAVFTVLYLFNIRIPYDVECIVYMLIDIGLAIRAYCLMLFIIFYFFHA